MKELYLTQNNLNSFFSEIEDLIVKLCGRKSLSDFSLDNSALLITDIQNYFLDEDSHAFIPSALSIIDNINLLIKSFVNAGKTIIFTKHYNNDNQSMMSVWWKDLMIKDLPSNDLYMDLMMPDNRIVIEKEHYDAFVGTKLFSLLSQHNITTLIICGVMANLCCETTARSAFIKGFNTIIPVDAIAAYNYEFHKSSCLNLAFGFSKMTSASLISNKLQHEAKY